MGIITIFSVFPKNVGFFFAFFHQTQFLLVNYGRIIFRCVVWFAWQWACNVSNVKLKAFFFKKNTLVFQNSRFDMFSENYGTFWLFPCLNDTDETNGKFYYWLNNIFQGVFFLKPMKQIGNSIFTNFDFWHTLNQPWPTVQRDNWNLIKWSIQHSWRHTISYWSLLLFSFKGGHKNISSWIRGS